MSPRVAPPRGRRSRSLPTRSAGRAKPPAPILRCPPNFVFQRSMGSIETGRTKVQKVPKQEYTAEFKEQAVRRAREVGVGVASRELGLVAQTLRNWAKAAAGGKLNAAGAKAVTPEEMEPSRLRAENAQLKMHVEILKKRRRTLRRMRCEVRLDRRAAPRLSIARHVQRTGRQHQRLAGPAQRRNARFDAAQRRPSGDADQGDPRRGQRRVRLASNASRTQGTRAPNRHQPSGTRDARGWHPSAAQAALQGGDGFEAFDAGRRKPAGSQLHAAGAEQGLDR